MKIILDLATFLPKALKPKMRFPELGESKELVVKEGDKLKLVVDVEGEPPPEEVGNDAQLCIISVCTRRRSHKFSSGQGVVRAERERGLGGRLGGGNAEAHGVQE